MEIIFEICDDFEADSITQDKWGNTSVYINNRIEPYFISITNGNMFIEFAKKV